MPPEETTTPAPAAETPTAETPPAAAPATVTITQEQWDRMNAQMHHMGGQLAALGAAQANVRVTAPPPAAPLYTEEQLAEMLESGEGRKILAAQRYIADQATAPVRAEFGAFREATMVTAGDLGRDIVEASGKIPFYKDPEIKRQIDSFMATLPAEALANKESIVLAHNYVVAQPENLDRIIKSKVEEEMRKRSGNPGVPDATTAGGRVPASGGTTVPTVAELLGDSSAQALRAQGKTPDEFARRIGHKSWAEYAKFIQSEQAGDEEEVH